MRSHRSILIVLALMAALAVAWARPTPAAAQDNAAVAVNTKDGTSLYRLALQIVRTNKDVVDNQNAAVAFASCTNCSTVALAFQAVLIFGDPDTVTPVNLALAENVTCSECLAFAWAYQNVFTTGGPVHFTAEGNQRLRDLRQGFRDLLDSLDGFTPEQAPSECSPLSGALLEACYLESRLLLLQDEFRDILATELVPAAPPEAVEQREPATGATEPVPTTTGTTTGPTEPTGTTATEPGTTTETTETTGTTETETTGTAEETEPTTTEPTTTTP